MKLVMLIVFLVGWLMVVLLLVSRRKGRDRDDEAIDILRDTCGIKVERLGDGRFYIVPLDEVADSKRLQTLAGMRKPDKR